MHYSHVVFFEVRYNVDSLIGGLSGSRYFVSLTLGTLLLCFRAQPLFDIQGSRNYAINSFSFVYTFVDGGIDKSIPEAVTLFQFFRSSQWETASAIRESEISSHSLLTSLFPFSGAFEPPGSQALAAFVAEREREAAPTLVATMAAELATERAKKAEAVGRVPAGEVESCLAFEQELSRQNANSMKSTGNAQLRPNQRCRSL
jgi:hypothetical protein